MKYYLGNVNQFLAHKNKLDKAVKDYVVKYHRILFRETEIEKVKDTITAAIIGMNDLYPKCTQIQPSWWTPASDEDDYKDWILSGVDCVRFAFFCSKESGDEQC